MKVRIDSIEMYPVYVIVEEGDDAEADLQLDDIPETSVTRWREAQLQFEQAQLEMRNVIDPLCPECGHRGSRHQEWSAQWDNWGCLVHKCQCRYGCPPERLAELQEHDNV